MSKIKVNSLEGVGASTPAITIDNASGTCTANITNNLSNRNLIINGAMQVAQRGTSSTAEGYLVDRFRADFGGTDEAPTFAQVDVASGTTPYTSGFRKALKITNGNQTSGAGASDFIMLRYKAEAQDIANSGWNYTSSSSYITLSFWVKSSVAQNFYGYLETSDGTAYLYPFETGSLSADTWTKVTKTISGNSNLTFNNDNGQGLILVFNAFRGTDTTGSVSLNAWGAYNSSNRVPDMTSTWYTTNDATFEITGVQLEVGSVATDFEHRSFNQELALCQRYYYILADARDSGSTGQLATGFAYHNSQVEATIHYPVMRASPSLVQATGTNYYGGYNNGSNGTFNNFVLYQPSPRVALLYQGSVSGAPFTQGQAYRLQLANDNAYIHFSAEL